MTYGVPAVIAIKRIMGFLHLLLTLIVSIGSSSLFIKNVSGMQQIKTNRKKGDWVFQLHQSHNMYQ